MKDIANPSWGMKPLGEVLQVLNGYAFKSKQFSETEGTPLIRIRDLKAGLGTVVNFVGDYDPQYVVDDGDLLIGMDGEFRCYEWQGGEALLNQRVCKLTAFSNELLPRFLFYGINKYLKEIEDRTAYTTVKHLSSKTIKSIDFPLPPLEEQHRIVAVLDEAFEGLARARAHAEANLQNARELFSNQLGCVFSTENVGWVQGTVGELCSIKSGTTVPKSQEQDSGDIAYVKVGDMNLPENDNGIQTSSRFLSKSDVSERKIIPSGATIFPKRGGAIMTNKKRKVLQDICADLNVMGVIPGKKVDEDFLFFFFESLDMGKIGSGSAIPQINNYDISPLAFSYPTDLNEQRVVADELRVLALQTDNLTDGYIRKLQDIDELRQSILQRAFAGELT